MIDRDPEPLPHDAERAGEVLGDFANDVMALTITTDGRALTLDVRIEPEIRAASDTDLPPTSRRPTSASSPVTRTSTS
ncbi:hypothetical protein [Streptomyces sp. NPDC017949]|uniref:hypothetical protein n=1 Tax=Streptomyces sp. NPDC017949 TaxID=3365020 RepID=UPI0037A92D71